jgi:hypothetical protein
MHKQEQKPVEQKKQYSAPTLVVHGGVEQLTQVEGGSRPVTFPGPS